MSSYLMFFHQAASVKGSVLKNKALLPRGGGGGGGGDGGEGGWGAFFFLFETILQLMQTILKELPPLNIYLLPLKI